MKKRSILILVLVICIVMVSAALLGGCGKEDDTTPSAVPTMPADFDSLDEEGRNAWNLVMMRRAGAAYKQYMEEQASSSNKVVARYGDFTVTQAEIHYRQEVEQIGITLNTEMDAHTIAEQIIGSRLALEEAERQGMAATDTEIQEYVQSLRANYENYPEAWEQVDAYCAAAGQTLEEYLQGIEERAYSTITSNRFKNQFYEQWEAEHAFVEPGNQDEYMKAVEEWQAEKEEAYDAYIATLIEQHKDEIEFYI